MHHTAKVVASALALGIGALASVSASASGVVHQCGTASSPGQAGLGVTDIRARGISCSQAKHVAPKTRAHSKTHKTVTVVDGVPWACRFTQTATGTGPGFVATSKVTCTGPNHSLLLYHLHS